MSESAGSDRLTSGSAAVFYGTRANVPRMRELLGYLTDAPEPPIFVNTGQHWDPELMGEGMGPEITGQETNLDLRTSSLKIMVAAVTDMLAAQRSRVKHVIVYGDTNSGLAPALAARELGLPITHVEAGFRTYDAAGKRVQTALTEEDNRCRIDGMADRLLPLTPTAAELLHWSGLSGIIEEPLGHPLADVVIQRSDIIDSTPVEPGLGLLTVHRQENLADGGAGLRIILDELADSGVYWIMPAVPAVGRLLESCGIRVPSNVEVVPPFAHMTVLETLGKVAIVCTDSAGLSLEAGLAGVPLVVPRSCTEYPELLDYMHLVAPANVGAAVSKALAVGPLEFERRARLRAAFGGGTASRRIADSLIAGYRLAL